jgi:SAM-dependent methyltransferase
MSQTDPYVLGRSEAETRRLILQHLIYAPLTRRVFEAAGIGAGMRVLDVGSGAGDVALLLAELVGPTGRVVGVDLNAAILDTARARVAAAGWRNVEFHAGEAAEVAPGEVFDAAVGRWVLMYQPDPAALLRRLATRLRAGGVVAFHENDFGYPPGTFPPSALSQQVQRWSLPPGIAAGPPGGAPGEAPGPPPGAAGPGGPPGPGGPEMRMGTKLFQTYLDAGLPAPQLRLEAPIGGGPDWPGYEYTAETLRSLLPAMQRLTGADAATVGIDTLAERMRQDAVDGRRVQMLPMMIGAWARTPA